MSTTSDPTPKQLREIFHEYFKIDTNDVHVNFELFRREHNPAAFDRMRKNFEKALAASPDREGVLRRSFFGATFSIHLQSTFPRSQLRGIPQSLLILYPVCTKEELLALRHPRSVEDDLLALRANAIADSSRLKRVFLHRRALREQDWSLTSSFDGSEFEKYISTLPHPKQARCRRVTGGFAFLVEPNGACIRSPRGDLIVISEALQQYLYYMNAFLFDPKEFSVDDRLAALMIAIRTMFLKESLDFDLDPRGNLPAALDHRLRAVTHDQIQFVIGHEYGHLLMNHLDHRVARDAPRGVIPGYVAGKLKYYNPLQKQELAADVAALLDPVVDDQVLADRLMGAIWFFLGLEVFYGVSRFMKNSAKVTTTHPPPLERAWALHSAVLTAKPSLAALVYSDEELTHYVSQTQELKARLLTEFFPNNRDQLEVYGSTYLPNFRGRQLADHVDY